MSELYPWLQPAWQRLQASVSADRLPHGLLLAGPQGTGKRAFALALAHALLCLSPRPNGHACGRCRGCDLIAAGSHPDLLVVSPLEDSSVIRIEQIRELIVQLALTSSQASGRRVAVIHPAEAMNRSAANSLLKTLEEPPLNTTLVLVSDAAALLPATVRSRCQRIQVSVDAGVAAQWLSAQLGEGVPAEVALGIAGGGPLLALKLKEEGVFEVRTEVLQELGQMASGRAEPIAVAGRWATLPWRAMLRVLASLVLDLTLQKRGETRELVRNTDLTPALRSVAERLDLNKLLSAQQLIHEYWRLLGAGSSLRAQDLLEDFAIRWSEG